MSQARIHNFAISLDGYGTGEGQSRDLHFGHADAEQQPGGAADRGQQQLARLKLSFHDNPAWRAGSAPARPAAPAPRNRTPRSGDSAGQGQVSDAAG